MNIHSLKPQRGSRTKKHRVGRGNASGSGPYADRGVKGQSSRTGGKRRPGFEGGQTPLLRRMPKLGGFKNPNREEYLVVNVGDLAKYFKDGETVNRTSLVEKGLIPSKKSPIKILGNGDLGIALTLKVDKVSKSAAEKIAQSKGKIE